MSQCLSLTSSYEKIFFLASPSDNSQLNCLKRMEANGLFQLVEYDYKHLADDSHIDTVLCSNIKSYFLGLLSENGCNIDTVDEVFVSNSGAYCLFELFLVLMKIPYSLVEFSPNEFSSKRLIKSIDQYEEISRTYRGLAFSTGTIVGKNNYCKCHIYYSGSELDKTLHGETSFFNPLAAFPEYECINARLLDSDAFNDIVYQAQYRLVREQRNYTHYMWNKYPEIPVMGWDIFSVGFIDGISPKSNAGNISYKPGSETFKTVSFNKSLYDDYHAIRNEKGLL